MKIVLLGADGQVGHALRGPLAKLGELTTATRVDADFRNSAALLRALDDANAEVIVNAAAYTAVDRAEEEPALADRINHRAVGEIGAWAAARGALVVHYSTDYVFEGSATRPYSEGDATAPTGAYARSKRDGEDALRASGARHLILRTAWVYGARGNNFLLTMLRLARERDEIRVVADQVGSPTTVRWIAAATAQILGRLQRMQRNDREQALGTYHLTASSRCSWFEFAEAIMAEAVRTGLLAHAPRIVPISTAEYPTRARRPAWSVLDTVKLSLVFGLQCADWQQGLHEVIEELARSQGETR